MNVDLFYFQVEEAVIFMISILTVGIYRSLKNGLGSNFSRTVEPRIADPKISHIYRRHSSLAASGWLQNAIIYCTKVRKQVRLAKSLRIRPLFHEESSNVTRIYMLT